MFYLDLFGVWLLVWGLFVSFRMFVGGCVGVIGGVLLYIEGWKCLGVDDLLG